MKNLFAKLLIVTLKQGTINIPQHFITPKTKILLYLTFIFPTYNKELMMTPFSSSNNRNIEHGRIKENY